MQHSDPAARISFDLEHALYAALYFDYTLHDFGGF
jgi:hypothetical protein